jgi:4-diphosphocytidyl-2-C-methyl-D-erythritol kinase
MVTLGLADRLSLATATGPTDTLHVAGFDAGPVADNLVLRAIAAAREAVGAGWAGPAGPPPVLAARLEKRVPVAAGLAGGSSDAAAALDGALEAWGASLSIHERLRVAGRLGSDVPFFLAGGAALVEGRGETVTPLRGIVGDPPGVLLVTPGLAVPTPAVFAAYAAGAGADRGGAARLSSNHLAEELRAGLTARALIDRAGVLAVANDLLPAAAVVVPELPAARRALGRRLDRPVGLSGSGPTLWVLYPSLGDAETAAADVRVAIARGELTLSGGEPFIAATTITGQQPTDRSVQ